MDTFIFRMLTSKQSGERYVLVEDLLSWLLDAKEKNPHFIQFIDFAIVQFAQYPKDECLPVRNVSNWLSDIKDDNFELTSFIDFFKRQLWKEIYTVQ